MVVAHTHPAGRLDYLSDPPLEGERDRIAATIEDLAMARWSLSRSSDAAVVTARWVGGPDGRGQLGAQGGGDLGEEAFQVGAGGGGVGEEEALHPDAEDLVAEAPIQIEQFVGDLVGGADEGRAVVDEVFQRVEREVVLPSRRGRYRAPPACWPGISRRFATGARVGRHGQKPSVSRTRTMVARSGRASRSTMRILPMNELWP